MTPDDRFKAIHSQLLDLEQHRRRMRAHEPRHSDPEHACTECEILGTLDHLRKTQATEKYSPDEKCESRMCGHPWGDHWDDGPCAIWECPCAGMVHESKEQRKGDR